MSDAGVPKDDSTPPTIDRSRVMEIKPPDPWEILPRAGAGHMERLPAEIRTAAETSAKGFIDRLKKDSEPLTVDQIERLPNSIKLWVALNRGWGPDDVDPISFNARVLMTQRLDVFRRGVLTDLDKRYPNYNSSRGMRIEAPSRARPRLSYPTELSLDSYSAEVKQAAIYNAGRFVEGLVGGGSDFTLGQAEIALSAINDYFVNGADMDEQIPGADLASEQNEVKNWGSAFQTAAKLDLQRRGAATQTP